MIVRCHGARGSIPVSGEEYLRYGGDTTCVEIRTKNDEIIIVDAGSGIRRLGIKLLAEKRFEYNIIFTHSHWDHILGFPFFRPIYSENTTINLMGCPETQGDIQKILSRAMSAPLFPIQFERLKAAFSYSGNCSHKFCIDSVEIHPIRLSHPNMGLGYKFVEDGRSFVFLTDNELGFRHSGGLAFEDYAKFVEGADLLVHDSEYSREQYEITRSWGHSTYLDALELAFAGRVKRFALCHHNQDRSDDEQDVIVQRCREAIKKRRADIECTAFTQTTELVV
ncbi:MAG: MBL fold metallo-hydrolase [Desulfobacteraceae bacterium]|nr:MBL fold metallo-hydrolase [Desulfobacteraceae bacterium]